MASFFMLGAQERIGEKNQLMKLAKLINWESIRPYLKGLYKNEEHSQGGPIPYDTLKLFKAVLLGQWHNLSDPKLEESLRVRLDFMLFTGFEVGEDLPDETTLCRFRNKLIEKKLDHVLFNVINQQLEQLGLVVHSAKGAIVDATIIESVARPRRTLEITEDRAEPEQAEAIVRLEESVDPDACWLKKGNRCYFGDKGFIRMAEKSGFIQAVQATPANSSELKQLDKLIDGFEGESLYDDKGYACEENRQLLKRKKIKNRLMYKATRNKPLTHWQKTFNWLVSKKRYLVEQAFGTLKRRFHCGRASYITQAKVGGQLHLKAICFNLLKAVNQVQLT